MRVTTLNDMKNQNFVSLSWGLLLVGFTAIIQAEEYADGPLLIPKNDFAYDEFIQIGTLASPSEICDVLSHPIFSQPSNNYDQLDSINSDFRWDGIQASNLWVAKMFEKAGAEQRSRLYLEQNTQQRADYNLAMCLYRLEVEGKQPGTYQTLQTRFLHYLQDNCHIQQFETKTDVDDEGNLIEEQIPLPRPACIDFGYNSGRYSDWNSTTFSLMLVWKEAHKVLPKIFDKGIAVIEARVAQRNAQIAKEQREQAERRENAAAQQAERDQLWNQYRSREKTLLERVYNFAYSGNPSGSEYSRWIEIEPCVLSNGSKRIDNRKINMTAFRIYPELDFNNDTVIISTDRSTIRFSAPGDVPIDRLQDAWNLAFKECPGRTSEF
jgi:hypothetical protein